MKYPAPDKLPPLPKKPLPPDISSIYYRDDLLIYVITGSLAIAIFAFLIAVAFIIGLAVFYPGKELFWPGLINAVGFIVIGLLILGACILLLLGIGLVTRWIAERFGSEP